MVRLARPDDAPALDDVLADAFFDDPISMHLLPDASCRRDRLAGSCAGVRHVRSSAVPACSRAEELPPTLPSVAGREHEGVVCPGEEFVADAFEGGGAAG